MVKRGSRAQVMNENADETSGGLRKKDLMYKNGRIVSIKASRRAKRENRLVKAGFVTQKGKFGTIKVEPKSSPKAGRRSRSRSRSPPRRRSRSRSRSRPRSRRK